MGPVSALVVPGSLTLESPNPQVATHEIGQVGRAAAIYGVDEVVVYEEPEHREGRQVARVLEYQATAPYLRQHLFPISDDLAHVGVLPPLNLPAHLVPSWVEPGQVRMGAMAGKRVEIGLEEQAELELEDREQPEPGEQFPVEVTAARHDKVRVRPHEPDEDEFLSFEVRRAPSLSTALDPLDAVLGTSREGEPARAEHAQARPALAFGTPEQGLPELSDDPPPLVNTIPDQQARSVRVEEAVLASLAHLDALA
jgi:predicted SPOUT superfamily RNA methylase MTH1